jgi:phosphoglycolate phosphatase
MMHNDSNIRPGLVSLDLDGTLIDTAGEIAEAANRTLRELGLAEQPVAAITLLIGRGAHALMRQLLAQSGAVVDAAVALARLDRHLEATTGTLSRPYAGAHEALALLRAHGVRLACVTNKEMRHAERVLQAHGFAAKFDLVIGGNSLPQKKPHASVLQHVAATLGVPLHAMAHVGDSAVDVQAARNAGVAAWAVPYGYNAGEPIASAQPDRVFVDLLEMARHVVGSAPDRPAQTPR